MKFINKLLTSALCLLMVTLCVFGLASCSGKNENPNTGNNPPIGTTPERNDTSTYKIEGDYIYFGTYPQTLKSASVTVSEEPNSEGYYLGSDGEYYAKITSDKHCYAMNPDNYGEYIDFKFANGEKIASSKTYYFKVEPIKWRIVKSDSNKALLIADVVLDVQKFNASQSQKTVDGKTVYSSNYEHSDLRQWLNESFFNTAFTSTQQSLINTYAVDNGAETTYSDSCIYYSNTTFDKVFLFSYQDFKSEAYGFNYSVTAKDAKRIRISTDYSRALGCMSIEQETFGNGTYWLRSPAADEGNIFVSAMYSDGRMNTYGYDYSQITEGISGVVPALLLQLNGDALNSNQECSHTWNDWVVSKEATCTVAGIKTRICSLCFKNDKDTSALGHTYDESQATIVPATCTNTGTADYACTRCGVVVSDVLDALGHSFTNYITTDATCTSDSYKTAKCDRCEEIDTITNEDTALGHNYGVDGKCTRCSIINPNLKVTSLEISNDSFLLEAGKATQVKFVVYPSDAVYEKVTYKIYQNNTCEATLSENGLLTCGKVGSVTVAVTIDDEITARATFYVPQMITTAEEFYNIRNDLGGVYMLANNIDLSGYANWIPIGNATKNSSGNYDYTNAFSGKFDGGGYTISGLNINLSDSSCSSLLTVGLFGSLSRDGQVSNVVLKDAKVTGTGNATDYVGMLVGFNPGSVKDCNVTGTTTLSGATYIGGVIGENIGFAEKISSNVTITVTGSKNYLVGGITGRTTGGQLSDVSVLGSINVTSNTSVYVGGVAGNLVDRLTTASADVDITVKTTSSSSSYNYVGIIAGSSSQSLSDITVDGSITVESYCNAYVGGIVGYSDASISKCINNAIIALTVSNSSYSSSYVGGIVGNTSKNVEDCSNNGSVSATQFYGGYVGGIAGMAGAISRCENNAAIYAKSTSKAVYCGGIAGYAKSIDASNNNAKVNALIYANNTNHIGGVIGYSEGEVSNCINNEKGEVVVNYSNSTSSSSSKQYFGGIVGYVKNSITDSANYANISAYSNGVIYCGGVAGYTNADATRINNYAYSITITSGNTNSSYANYIGGIAGYANGKLETAYNTALLNVTKGNVVVGGVAGYVNSTVSSTQSTADITINNSVSGQNVASYVGGVIGNTPSSITSSSATNNNIVVDSRNKVYVGGVVGNCGGTITECYAYPNITVSNSYVAYTGGVSGYAKKIIKSYSTSNIISNTLGSYDLYVGGLSGYIVTAVEECYATGDISGTASSKVYMAGLIGYVGNGASIKNCYVSNGYIKTNSSAFSSSLEIQIYNGGLVAYNDGTISNCYAVNYNYSISYGSSNNHSHYIGGLVAYNDGTITSGYVLDATDKLARTGLEINRDVVGSGTAKKFYAGGFVGYNQGAISDCYSDATVNTTVSGAYTGGFVGFNNATIKNAIAYGEVNSGITGDTTGGFAGGGASGYTSCFFSKDDTLQSTSVGSSSQSGITASTNASLRTATTFNGFSSSCWKIVDGTYPTLVFGATWENRSDGFNKYNMLVGVPNKDNQYQFPHSNRVTISFESNGGEAINSIIVTKNDIVSLPTLDSYVSNGKRYMFVNWSSNKDLTELISFQEYVVRDDTILYAYFCEAIDLPATLDYVYSGDVISVSNVYKDTSMYSVSGDINGKIAGQYKLVFELNNGYCWSNGSTDDYVLTWTIKKATLDKPSNIEIRYTGKLIDLYDVYSMNLYNLSNTYFATDIGEYIVTFSLNDSCVWSDGTTSNYTVSWKIENATVISYNPSKTVAKVSDVLNVDFLEAKATDGHGKNVLVAVESITGKLIGGNVVTVKLSATAENGYTTIQDVNVRIYDTPQVMLTQDGYTIDKNTNIETLFSVYDSFGEKIDAQITYSALIEGEIVEVTVCAIDCVGNVVNSSYSFGVISSEKPYYVELLIDGAVWKRVFLESNIQYNLPVPTLDNGVFYGWRLENFEYCTYSSGEGLVEIAEYTKLYAVTYDDGFTPIETVEQLINMSSNNNYVLVNNIDLEGRIWVPISDFNGIFDGNGFVISNLNITGDINRAGLFSVNSGVIKNVGLVDVTINTVSVSDYYATAGGLAGRNDGTILNCYVCGDVSSFGKCAETGMIAGYNNGYIVNCHSSGNVFGTSSAGWNYGSVGGIAGYNHGDIGNAYSTANIVGVFDGEYSIYVGGITGLNYGSLYNCFATGNLSGMSGRTSGVSIGGVCASAYDGYVENCYRSSQQTFERNNKGTITYTASNSVGIVVDLEYLQDVNWIIENIFKSDSGIWIKQNGEIVIDFTVVGKPVVLETVEDIKLLEKKFLVCDYILVNDIDLAGKEFGSIKFFAGNFNGNQHTIINFVIKNVVVNGGMFEVNIGNVSALNLKQFCIDATAYSNFFGETNAVGGLVGDNRGTVDNCCVEGTINIVNASDYDDSYIGGIVGLNYGVISKSSSSIILTVSSTDGESGYVVIIAGGFVGVNFGEISDCCATGTIVAKSPTSYATTAGFSGENSGEILNSFASVDCFSEAQGSAVSGGFVANNTGVIENSFAVGNVIATDISGTSSYAGMFIGKENGNNGEISNCWYADEQSITGEINYISATKTFIEILKTETFVKETLTWSDDIWNIKDGEYPTLK